MKYLAAKVVNNIPCVPYQDKAGKTFDTIPVVELQLRETDDDFTCPLCDTKCSEHDIKFTDEGDMFYRVCDYFDDPEIVAKWAGRGRSKVDISGTWTKVDIQPGQPGYPLE